MSPTRPKTREWWSLFLAGRLEHRRASDEHAARVWRVWRATLSLILSKKNAQLCNTNLNSWISIYPNLKSITRYVRGDTESRMDQRHHNTMASAIHIKCSALHSMLYSTAKGRWLVCIRSIAVCARSME